MSEKTCSVPGCGGKHEAKGFCITHYSRLRRGEEIDVPIRRIGVRHDCSVATCRNRAVVKGLCKTHDARARRGADLNEPIKRVSQDSQCKFKGCDRHIASHGYCSGHRRQQLLYGENGLRPIGAGKRRGCTLETCAIVGCERAQYANAMCNTHDARAGKYKLTVIQLQMLLLVDECPVCHDEITEATGAIDHDHTCCPGSRTCGNCIIGILCQRCNAGIGYFTNHPGVMMSAIEYLLRTRTL
jgi:hypothetical protein